MVRNIKIGEHSSFCIIDEIRGGTNPDEEPNFKMLDISIGHLKSWSFVRVGQTGF